MATAGGMWALLTSCYIVLSILMHDIISLADTTSYDNVLFAGVGIVV